MGGPFPVLNPHLRLQTIQSLGICLLLHDSRQGSHLKCSPALRCAGTISNLSLGPTQITTSHRAICHRVLQQSAYQQQNMAAECPLLPRDVCDRQGAQRAAEGLHSPALVTILLATTHFSTTTKQGIMAFFG